MKVASSPAGAGATPGIFMGTYSATWRCISLCGIVRLAIAKAIATPTPPATPSPIAALHAPRQHAQ